MSSSLCRHQAGTGDLSGSRRLPRRLLQACSLRYGLFPGEECAGVSAPLPFAPLPFASPSSGGTHQAFPAQPRGSPRPSETSLLPSSSLPPPSFFPFPCSEERATYSTSQPEPGTGAALWEGTSIDQLVQGISFSQPACPEHMLLNSQLLGTPGSSQVRLRWALRGTFATLGNTGVVGLTVAGRWLGRVCHLGVQLHGALGSGREFSSTFNARVQLCNV